MSHLAAVDYNNIGEVGAAALSEALKQIHQLTELFVCTISLAKTKNVGASPLGPRGVTALIPGLKALKKLSVLFMCNTL